MTKQSEDLETGSASPTFEDDQVETTARTSAPHSAPGAIGATRLIGITNRDAGLDDPGGDVVHRRSDNNATTTAAVVVHPLPAVSHTVDASLLSSFLPPSAVAEAQSVTPPLVEEVQAIHISSTLLHDEQIVDLQERLAESEQTNAALLLALAQQAAPKRRRTIQDRSVESEPANAAMLPASTTSTSNCQCPWRWTLVAVALCLALLGGGGVAL
jgi:hypothetical protein